MTPDVRLVDASVTTDLRRAVLRPAWAPGSVMHGDDDPGALHVAAVSQDGRVVGACVLLPNAYPARPDLTNAWQLRGMATAAGQRGAGIGAAMIAGSITAVAERGATLLWCKARETAVAFYRRHGFTVDSETYFEPQTGLLHRDMSRLL